MVMGRVVARARLPRTTMHFNLPLISPSFFTLDTDNTIPIRLIRTSPEFRYLRLVHLLNVCDHSFYQMKKLLLTLLLATTALFCPRFTAYAEEPPEDIAVSPKPGWGDFSVVEEEEDYPWYTQALLWIPNRIVDFIDIFRIDIGVGPSIGAVARITRWGQMGYRGMMPVSYRIGDFGREYPMMVESSNEFGFGPLYVQSKDRDICAGELGAGADLFIIGAYGGICVEELADFITGLVFIDIMDDDFK